MNATKYQIFLKTVECGSFTKAAEELNFSQSGISHAISSLEEELGVTLLSRNRGGVTLTGDGRALLPQIQQLCTEYHRLAQQAADLRGMDAGCEGGLVFQRLRPVAAHDSEVFQQAVSGHRVRNSDLRLL